VGVTPVIRIMRNDRILKSTPSNLRNNPAFIKIKEECDKLKTKLRRIRNLLESMMATGESVPRKDLYNLARIPETSALLANLAGINEQQEIGLIDAANMQLIGEQTNYPIGESLRIAHAYDLIQHDVLPYWQQLIVEREIVQPFKQIFRETYLLTPAEKEADNVSERFAGLVILSKVAYRLFESRGWETGPLGAFKSRIGGQYCVTWRFTDIHNYFSWNEKISSGHIHFGVMVNRDMHKVPLCDVPPIVLSEVMRDADLVIAVAGTGEESDERIFPSKERMQHRATLARYLATRLGIQNLRFEDNFVHIPGKLANYRIHLSHAGVYLDTGPHICITPSTNIRKLYLPFADEDAKATEIISKILLLHNDDTITDNSILDQINRFKAVFPGTKKV